MSEADFGRFPRDERSMPGISPRDGMDISRETDGPAANYELADTAYDGVVPDGDCNDIDDQAAFEASYDDDTEHTQTADHQHPSDAHEPKIEDAAPESLTAEWRNPPKNPIVEKVVGRVDLPPDDFEGYDERRQIVADVEDAIETMRSNMRKVAEAAEMKVTDEEVAAWQPGPVEIAKLRRDFATLRQRANMIRGAEAYIEDQVMEAAAEGVKMRPHQQDVVVGLRNFLVGAERTSDKGGKAGMIELPTGAGKTRVMVEAASLIRHMQDPEEQNRIIIITPTGKIQEQTVGADGNHGFGKFRPDEEVGRYDESTPPQERAAALKKGIVAICAPSFLRLKEAGMLPDNVGTVIVDETHTVMGPKMCAAVEDYIADKVAIGLDATPELDEESPEDVTTYKIFKHQIAQMELVEAIRGGILTSVRAWVKHVSPVVNERSLPEEPAARRAAMREASMIAKERAAVGIVKEELERGYREVPGKHGRPSRGFGVMVRCQPGDNVNYAFRFAKSLEGMFAQGPDGPFDLRPIMPAFVGGDSKRQTKAERDDAYTAYGRKGFNVLAVVRAAGIGFDDDGTNAYVNLYRGSERQLRQGIGRALRKMVDSETGEIIKGPDGKPIEAHLYDLVDDTEVNDPKRPTVLSILGVKPGERIEADSRPDAPIPRPRTMGERSGRTVRAPEVVDVVTTTVGTTALEGIEVEVGNVEDVGTTSIEADVVAEQPAPKPELVNPYAPSGWPNQTGLSEFAEVFGTDMEVPLAEACRILGFSAVTMKGTMKNLHGDSNRLPTLSDLTRLLEERPGLQAPPQPDEGFQEIGPKERAIRGLAQREQVRLHRFTKADGTIGGFLSDDEVRHLLQVAEADEARRQGRGRR